MMRFPRIVGTAALALALAVTAGLPSAGRAAAGDVKGALTHKGKTVTLKHAYLVTGSDVVDANTMVRRIILSGKDVRAKVAAARP